jgi:Fe-S-cluster formation regulator IscX/YfhJ
MTDNQKRILELLAEKKITSEEAYRLLNAMETGGGETGHRTESENVQKLVPKYLRVTVIPGENADPKHADRVNVRVPMSLIRAGIKLTSLIPVQARDKIDEALKDKGIDFDIRNIRKEDLDELINALADMEVDVETGHGEKVRVFVEY